MFERSRKAELILSGAAVSLILSGCGGSAKKSEGAQPTTLQATQGRPMKSIIIPMVPGSSSLAATMEIGYHLSYSFAMAVI